MESKERRKRKESKSKYQDWKTERMYEVKKKKVGRGKVKLKVE